MKRFRIFPSIVMSAFMLVVPGLLVNTLGSSATAKEQGAGTSKKSDQQRKKAAKKSESTSHQRRGEISQKLTPEQRALDSEILKSTQEQDEKSAKSF